ncbi:hypothetical protein H0H92_003424 [Tricholoma furcatifolium]|nr:hypothetical protein H0H92_003424 [Tricholoma furcatifolium]
MDALKEPHTSATPDAIAERLANDRSTRLEASSPQSDVFRKTSALIAAVRKIGCGALEHEETVLPPSERIQQEKTEAFNKKMQRGYRPTSARCKGRVYLKYHHDDGLGKFVLKCEHYTKNSRYHYLHLLDDSYDFDYLEAYFNEDCDELDRIEHEAFIAGYGPLADCSTVSNISSQKVCCRE